MKMNLIFKTSIFLSVLTACGKQTQDHRFSKSASTHDVQVAKEAPPTTASIPAVTPTNPVVDPAQKVSLQDWSALPAENNEFLIVPVKS